MASHVRLRAQICRRRADEEAPPEEHEILQRGDTVVEFTRVCHVTLDRFDFQSNLERQIKQKLLRRRYHVIFGDGQVGHRVTMEKRSTDRRVQRVAAAEAERLRRTKVYSHLRKIPVRMVLEVSVRRSEQLETAAALRESMEASGAFGAVPASRAAIDALDKTKLGEVLDAGDDECVICKEEVSRDEEVARLPCDHIFHHECIVRWLSASNLCPLCRFRMPIRSGDGD